MNIWIYGQYMGNEYMNIWVIYGRWIYGSGGTCWQWNIFYDEHFKRQDLYRSLGSCGRSDDHFVPLHRTRQSWSSERHLDLDVSHWLGRVMVTLIVNILHLVLVLRHLDHLGLQHQLELVPKLLNFLEQSLRKHLEISKITRAIEMWQLLPLAWFLWIAAIDHYRASVDNFYILLMFMLCLFCLEIRRKN